MPLTAAPTELPRDYRAVHPRRADTIAPLFPGMTLRHPRPTGVRARSAGSRNSAAQRQAKALAALSVAEAGERLVLDWNAPLRHATFYKAVYRPAVLRANRLVPDAALTPELKFHSLRHTYASLCVAAGIPREKLSCRMGHARIGTTLGIHTHLPPDDDACEDMDALDELGTPLADGAKALPLRGRLHLG